MKKSIIPLTIVALLAVAVGVFVVPEQSSTDTSKGYAFEMLREKASAVDRIVIENASGKLFSATKNGVNWLSTEFDGYPVSTKALSDLLQALVQAKKVEPKTAREDRYAKLGVEPVTSANANSVLVSLYQGDKKVTAVLVGNPASNGHAYIRKPTEKQSWLINTEVTLPFSRVEWLAQPVLKVPIDRVMSLAKLPVDSAHNTTDSKPEKPQPPQPEWVIQRASIAGEELGETNETTGEIDIREQDFVFSPTPANRSLKYPSVLRNAINSLLTMEFEGLKPFPDESTASGDTATAKEIIQYFRLQLNSGETLDIQLVEQEAEKWLRFTNYFPSHYAPETPNNGESAAPAVLQQNSHLFKWQYRLSDYNAGQWDKTLEDFFDMPEAETQTEGEE